MQDDRRSGESFQESSTITTGHGSEGLGTADSRHPDAGSSACRPWKLHLYAMT